MVMQPFHRVPYGYAWRESLAGRIKRGIKYHVLQRERDHAEMKALQPQDS